MEHSNNKTTNLNAQEINYKNNSSHTCNKPDEGLLSKFSIKISKKPVPATPRGVLAE